MKKKIIYILLFVLSLSLLLFGCQKDEPPTPVETDPPAEPVLPIVVYENGQNPYSIVYADNAESNIVNAAVALRASFEELGAIPQLCSEFVFNDKGGKLAIYVGKTGEETTVKLFDSLKYDDFVVHVENNNVYLIGGSDSATVKAVEYFTKTYLEPKPERLELAGDLDLKYTHKYATSTLSIAGAPIEEYKIVYDHSRVYAEANAQKIKELIIEQCGESLEVIADNKCAAGDKEILVGVTNRSESDAAANVFSSPNVYYSVTVSGTKLCITAQGVRTDEAVFSAVKKQFGKLTAENCNITSENFTVSGDILQTLDSSGMEARAEGTDFRIMQSNILIATTDDNDNGFTDKQRAELLADTYLAYMPDVITLNEMIDGRNIPPQLAALISDYYIIVEAEYLDLFGAPADPDKNFEQKNYATKVAYRKGIGLTVIDAGFNYLSDGISYHGASYAVFETLQKDRFIVLSGHLSENVTSSGAATDMYAKDILQILNKARTEYGDMPVIMGGDWFSWQGKLPYKLFIANGFSDASEVALEQHSVGIGTYHTIGKGEQDRVEEDIFFVNSDWIEVLAHKNLVDYYTVNSSDHYPVVIDISFKKSSKADELPDFVDGSGDLNIEDEGAGGSGTWGEDKV